MSCGIPLKLIDSALGSTAHPVGTVAIDASSTAIAFGNPVRFVEGFQLRHVDE